MNNKKLLKCRCGHILCAVEDRDVFIRQECHEDIKIIGNFEIICPKCNKATKIENLKDKDPNLN